MTGALPYRYIHSYFNKTHRQIIHRRQKVVFNNFRYIIIHFVCVDILNQLSLFTEQNMKTV